MVDIIHLLVSFVAIVMIKKMKKKVKNYYDKQTPIMSVCGYQFPNVSETPRKQKQFIFIKINNKQWYLLAETEDDIIYHFETCIGPIIRKSIVEYVKDEKNIYNSFTLAITNRMKHDTNKTAIMIAADIENQTLIDRLNLLNNKKKILLSNNLKYKILTDDIIITNEIIKESLLYPID